MVDHFQLAGLDSLFHISLTADAVFPVQIRVVYQGELCTFIGSGRVGQVHRGTLTGGDPGIAIEGVHQVQIVELKDIRLCFIQWL